MTAQPLIIPPWTPQRYIPHRSAVALTMPPRKPLTLPTSTKGKAATRKQFTACQPSKAERQATKRTPVTPAPILSDTDWCALDLQHGEAYAYGQARPHDRSWDAKFDAWVRHTYPQPILSDTTEWGALGLANAPMGYYMARSDSMGVQFTTPTNAVACGIVHPEREYTAEPPIEMRPILSQTTEWCALSLDDFPLVGSANRDSTAAGFTLYDHTLLNLPLVMDGYQEYTAEPPVPFTPFVPFALLSAWSVTTEPSAAFAPNTAPLIAARERKEADMLLRIKSDCLQPIPVAVAPVPVVDCPPAPVSEPAAEHVLQPVIMIDGRPETAERQAARIASMSMRKPGEKRTVFYFGREGAAQ